MILNSKVFHGTRWNFHSTSFKKRISYTWLSEGVHVHLLTCYQGCNSVSFWFGFRKKWNKMNRFSLIRFGFRWKWKTIYFENQTKPNHNMRKINSEKNSIWRFAHTRIFNFFHQNHFYVTPKPTMKNLKLVIKVINCVSFNPLDVCIKKKRTKGRRVEIRKTRK